MGSNKSKQRAVSYSKIKHNVFNLPKIESSEPQSSIKRSKNSQKSRTKPNNQFRYRKLYKNFKSQRNSIHDNYLQSKKAIKCQFNALIL